MSDWSRTQELMNVAANSAGTGSRQLALSMDSIETKLNKLKATWQEFYSNFLTSDLVKGILDALNAALTFLTEITTQLGNVNTWLKIVYVSLIALGLKTIITAGQTFGTAFMKEFKTAYAAARAKEAPKDIADAAAKGAAEGTAYGTAFATAAAAAKETVEAGENVKDTAEAAAKGAANAGVEAGIAATLKTAGSASGGLMASIAAKIAGFVASAASVIIPIAIVAVLAGATALIVKAVNDHIDKVAKEAGERVNQALSDINEITAEAKTTSDSYTKALELQRKGILRTAEETENYQKILNELKSTYPDLVKVLNDGTLELNSQSDAFEQYGEDAAKKIEQKYAVVGNNIQGAIKSGVMATETGLDAQSRLKNAAAIWKGTGKEESFAGKKGTAYDKLAESGLNYESAKDLLNVSNADEYWSLLQIYGTAKSSGGFEQRKEYIKSRSAEIQKQLEENNIDASVQDRLRDELADLDKEANLLGANGPNSSLNILKQIDEQTGGAVEDLYNEQYNLVETYANDFVNLYANLTGGKVSEAFKDGLTELYKGKDAKPEEIKKIAKEYYDSVSEEQQSAFNDYANSISTDLAINEKDVNVDSILQMLGLPTEGEVGQALREGLTGLFEERNKTLEELRNKYNDITGKGFDEEQFYSQFTGSSVKQVKQLITTMSSIRDKYGSAAASQFENSYRAYTDQISWDEDLVSQFASVDLTNISDISDYAALMATRFGETTDEYTKFVDLVNNSSNILDRTFQKYAQYIGDAKKEIQELDSSFDDLSSAAEGKLKIADAFSLMEQAGDALDLSDFYATADGYGLTQEKIKKVQEILIEQKKISYQLDLAQYQLKMETLQAQVQEVKELENINLAKYAQLTLDKAIRGLNKDEQDYYTQTTNSLREQGKLTEALDYIDAYRVSNTIPKIVDLMDKMTVNLGDQVSKAKKMRDVLKDFIEWLKKLDKYAAVDSFMEQLDFDIKSYDFNIEFSTNADEIADSIEGKINAINQLVNANLAKSNYAEKSAEEFRKTLEQDWGKYVSFDDSGNLIENADEFTAWGERIKALESENSVNQNLIDNENQRREVLDDLISQYREERKVMRETEQTAKDYIKQLKELNTQQLENIKNVEDKLLKLLEERDQKVIDNLKERYDYMKEQDQEYLDSVKEAVDKERKLRDQSQDYEDLNRQERKLQLLKMSGGSATEIQNLEQEIAKSRQDLADQEIDNLLDELSQEQELKQKKMDEEVEYLQAVQEAKLATMTEYNIEVKNIMSQGKTEIMNIFKAYDQEYITGTETARALWEQNIEQAIATAQAAMQTQANPAIEGVQNKVDELTRSQDLSKSSFETYANTVANMKGSLVSNIGEITETYLHQFEQIDALTKAYSNLAKAQGSVSSTASTANVGDLNSGLDTGLTTGFQKGDRVQHNLLSGNLIPYDEKGTRIGRSANLIGGREIEDIKTINGETYVKLEGEVYWVKLSQLEKATTYFKKSGYDSDYRRRTGAQKYAKGGLVDYTGPAWVDGTKSSPEAFLSAKDTANISALTDVLSRTFSMAKFTAAQSPQNNGDTYYQIHINVDELGDGYTVDDLVSEVENKILSITGRNSVIQVK